MSTVSPAGSTYLSGWVEIRFAEPVGSRVAFTLAWDGVGTGDAGGGAEGSVAPGVTLMPLKVLDDSERGRESALLDASETTLSLFQLLEAIQLRARESHADLRYRAALHARLAEPVTVLVFALLLSRFERASRALLYVSGLIQTIPALALLALMIPLMGLGEAPAIAALFLYSLLPITEEERVARRILLEESPHIVLHVVDARNLERMLPMTLQLIEAGLPVSFHVGGGNMGTQMVDWFHEPTITSVLPAIAACTALRAMRSVRVRSQAEAGMLRML